jgi:hypothetical protein
MQRKVGNGLHVACIVRDGVTVPVRSGGFLDGPRTTPGSGLCFDRDMEKTSPKPKTVASPLGPARVVAEAAVAAAGRAGEELVLQRLDTAAGPLVRLGYRRDGRMLRGPMSATPAELAELLREGRTLKLTK